MSVRRRTESQVAQDQGPGRARLVWVPLVLLLVAGVGYGLLAWWSSTRVPPDVDVAGVEIGGLSEGAARSALEDQLVPRAQLPLVVSVAGAQHQLSPEDAGLGVDLDATLGEVVGFSWEPRVIWRQFGGDTVDVGLAVTVDRAPVHPEAGGQLDP